MTPARFTFTPDTWNVTQVVHVVAVQDELVRPVPLFDGYIYFNFSSTDDNYTLYSQPPAVISIQDTNVGAWSSLASPINSPHLLCRNESPPRVRVLGRYALGSTQSYHICDVPH